MENNFDKLAESSNTSGTDAIINYFYDSGVKDYNIVESADKYSVWDLRVDYSDETILAEVKLRNKSYNTLMMESKKAMNLTSITTTEDNKPVTDHWYVNTFLDGSEPVIFSLNELRRCKKVKSNKRLTLSKTNFKGDYLLLGSISANKTTAYDTGKTDKKCWFIPETFKINKKL